LCKLANEKTWSYKTHFQRKFSAMKRIIEQKLIEWKNSPNRILLIVNGARQTRQIGNA
jgi:hypothetical protein